MHEDRTSTINALASHVLAGHRIPTLATPTTHEEQVNPGILLISDSSTTDPNELISS